MAISMTVGGISASWLLSSLSITDNINDRSTASFVLDSNAAIVPGMEVIISDGATRIFGGTVDSFSKRNIKGTSIKRYQITCVDFNQIGDRRRVAASYEDKTVSYIVNDIITNVLAAEGIIAGSIQTGQIMKQVVFNYNTVTECLNYLKDAAGLNWNIDYDKKLHVFNREDNTDTGFSDALGNFMGATRS